MCEMTEREVAENALTLICAIASAHAEHGWSNPILYGGLEATLHLAKHLEPDESTQELLDIIQTTLIETGEGVAENEEHLNKVQELLDKNNLTLPD
jgi:hypothetical protein